MNSQQHVARRGQRFKAGRSGVPDPGRRVARRPAPSSFVVRRLIEIIFEIQRVGVVQDILIRGCIEQNGEQGTHAQVGVAVAVMGQGQKNVAAISLGNSSTACSNMATASSYSPVLRSVVPRQTSRLLRQRQWPGGSRG